LTTLVFEASGNPSVLNGSNGSPAIATAVPVTAATEGKKQALALESFQGVAWEQLTTDLFKVAANEMDWNCHPTTPLPNP